MYPSAEFYFFVKVPVFGPIYTLQVFDVNHPKNDRVIHTSEVMNRIEEITIGKVFGYQFDIRKHAAHVVLGRIEKHNLITIKDEILYALPNSDLLTEKWEGDEAYKALYPDETSN